MRPAVTLVAALAFTAACSHTQATLDNGQGERAAVDTRGHQTPPSDTRPARAAHAPNDRPPTDAPAGAPAGGEAPPLATSPAGLLEPGAVKSIQQRLADAGLLDKDEVSGEMDGPTQAAIRKLQRQSGIPATGAIDTATAGKLGLDPDRVFKKAQTKTETKTDPKK